MQTAMFQPTGKPAVEPQVTLQPRSVVVVKGKEFEVERRLPNGRWQLLGLEDREPVFLSNADIAGLLRDGDFHCTGGKDLRVLAPLPVSPMAIGPVAKENNIRKHAYVMAAISEGYSRSRARVVPLIEACAAGRNETAPGFTTVLNWIDEYQRYGEAYGTAAYSDRHDLKGKHGSRLQGFQDEAIAAGIENWLKDGHKGRAYAIVEERVAEIDSERGHLIDKSRLGPNALTAAGDLKPPALRTFERRCSAENRMLQDWSLKGPAFAKQRNRTFQTRKLPDRPFQEVEVDHHTLDILIVDDLADMVLGRPDLIIFRDRATGMIAGRGLGFEAPSYASFVLGLEHLMYPKDMCDHPSAKTGWPCFGRIENLFVDNALHLIGDNIKAAGRELNFNVIPLRARQPWLKGALERWFGTLNTGLVHALPGTTLCDILTRKNHEFLGKPSITLRQFEALLDYWICEVYHRTFSKGLGLIRGLKEAPLEAWNRKAAGYSVPPPPKRDLFIGLAGDRATRTIQRDGIEWDYIKYESVDLWRLLQNPKHRRTGERGGPTQYQVVRDPNDLGMIHLINPHEHEDPIAIPATDAHREYARGLSKQNHDVIKANAAKKGRRAEFSDLVKAKASLAKIASDLRRHPSQGQIQKAIARYMNLEISRRVRSEIKPSQSASSEDYLAVEHTEAPRAEHTSSRREDHDDLDLTTNKRSYNSYVEQ